MSDDCIDDATEEIFKRVEALEFLYFGESYDVLAEGEDIESPLTNHTAWDVLTKLEAQIATFEDMLDPSESVEGSLVTGVECLAYSIANGLWLDATIVDPKPTPHTVTVRFSAAAEGPSSSSSGLVRTVGRDQVRPFKVDVVAISSAREALAELLRAHAPSSHHVGLPLAVPLTTQAQRVIVLESKDELLRASRHLETIYREPHRLCRFVDPSPAVKEMAGVGSENGARPAQTTALEQVEWALAFDVRRANQLAHHTRHLLDRYGGLLAHLNDRFVAWDEALHGQEARAATEADSHQTH